MNWYLHRLPHRGADTLVRAICIASARVSEGSNEIFHRIGRAVINDNNLEIGENLIEHTLYGFTEEANTGLRAARGVYIGQQDSDDLWLPELLASEVAALEAHPEVGAVYGRAQGMDAAGRLRFDTLGMPQRYPDDSFLSMLY